MPLNVRHPIWLPAATRPGIRDFALLFFIETFARASIATVVPVQAFDLFKNEQDVSFVYSAVGFAALGFSFVIPSIIRIASRRWTYTMGAFCLIVAALCLVTSTQVGQVGGMMFRVIGTACLNVTLNLYVLDYIRKHDFVRNDSVRIGFSVVGWTVAPYMGIWLYANYGPAASYSVSAGFALTLVAVFWILRLSNGKAISRGKSLPANPLMLLGHFFRQPRLRLAWCIAFGRSSFWSTFFVYAPILMVTTGQGVEAGGILVSAGNALLISIMFWGRAGERFGVRRLAAFAFLCAAASLFVASYTGEAYPILSAGLLLVTWLTAMVSKSVGLIMKAIGS